MFESSQCLVVTTLIYLCSSICEKKILNIESRSFFKENASSIHSCYLYNAFTEHVLNRPGAKFHEEFGRSNMDFWCRLCNSIVDNMKNVANNNCV